MQNWIKNKYEKKLYVPDNKKEPYQYYVEGVDPKNCLPETTSVNESTEDVSWVNTNSKTKIEIDNLMDSIGKIDIFGSLKILDENKVDDTSFNNEKDYFTGFKNKSNKTYMDDDFYSFDKIISNEKYNNKQKESIKESYFFNDDEISDTSLNSNYTQKNNTSINNNIDKNLDDILNYKTKDFNNNDDIFYKNTKSEIKNNIGGRSNINDTLQQINNNKNNHNMDNINNINNNNNNNLSYKNLSSLEEFKKINTNKDDKNNNNNNNNMSHSPNKLKEDKRFNNYNNLTEKELREAKVQAAKKSIAQLFSNTKNISFSDNSISNINTNLHEYSYNNKIKGDHNFINNEHKSFNSLHNINIKNNHRINSNINILNENHKKNSNLKNDTEVRKKNDFDFFG
ncbi:hypothetical protein PFFCH_00799 [Plasmodium falciparum FCH/4]|uniref:Uncharacterized protein n=1 Tax=Plasmodium falciparum FCH/4 TaxID=1036724 RepID=A0A024VSN3_PLAFA|nr:hypothetical protein PFFCH_00799 [Plasmodium falciparum FCH/4]